MRAGLAKDVRGQQGGGSQGWGLPHFPWQNPAERLDGMRFLLVQPLERKGEAKQVLERLHSTRRTGKWGGNPRVDSCSSQRCLKAPAAPLYFWFPLTGVGRTQPEPSWTITHFHIHSITFNGLCWVTESMHELFL